MSELDVDTIYTDTLTHSDSVRYIERTIYRATRIYKELYIHERTEEGIEEKIQTPKAAVQIEKGLYKKFGSFGRNVYLILPTIHSLNSPFVQPTYITYNRLSS